MSQLELSTDQKIALNTLLTWATNRKGKKFITLGGYAGTGKTTLISIFRKKLHQKIDSKLEIAFCSYTGRAVRVLKTKLEEENAIYPQDTISTIHGLIYSPIENDNEEIVGWDRKDSLDTNLIIVDEASMIDRIIWQDLLYYNIPIIAVGDHGQLPPIKGKFNLMERPHLKLEEIHRQAKDNPIINVSIFAREKGEVPAQKFDEYVVKYPKDEIETAEITEELLKSYQEDTIILCGYNSTRNKINQFIRVSLGFEFAEPQEGDRVICLRNNHEKEIYNGMLGTLLAIESASGDWYEVEIQMDNAYKTYRGLIYKPQFGAPNPINFTRDRKLAKKGDLFDFGYALTVHKAQGSQARKVILFEERFKQMDDETWKKWLYTGVTRAEEELILIG